MYIFYCPNNKDHLKIRSWAKYNNMKVYPCYYTYHNRVYLFKCSTCKNYINSINDFELIRTYVEWDGRVDNEKRICKCGNKIFVDRMCMYDTSSKYPILYVKELVNTLIVSDVDIPDLKESSNKHMKIYDNNNSISHTEYSNVEWNDIKDDIHQDKKAWFLLY